MEELLPANTTISHYLILSCLGAGGMGEVYLAEDTRLRRKVALKLLATDLTKNQDRLHRFEQEAQAASALNHPNILTIYEIGAEGETHFIATEFIEGETLRRHMARSRMNVHEVLDVAVQIASALADAHQAGIIHRDIKPENIMLRASGLVKVLDFGLAKLVERQVRAADTQAPTIARVDTDPGTVIGTINYMSPEQARGRTIDARSDIFSLGSVVYEMIAGRPPFEGESSGEVIASILDREPAPIARYAPEVPTELQRIVTKALRKDRDERYQTIKDFLIDLKSLKDELDVQAKLERSTSPEAAAVRLTASGGRGAAATASALPPQSEEVTTRTTSSAEYVVSEIKQHKIAALIAVIVIAAGIVGVSAYLRTRNSEVAVDSIAVLPFANTSGDPNTDYLSDGITESIISSLSQLPQLKVMARSTVFSYKGKDVDPRKVGHDLGVRAVLMGRLIQQGDNLTIRTELVNVADGTELWGQQYNRKLADVFAVQEEIAKEISEKLRLKLTSTDRQQLAKRPTENLKALQYYMQGRSYIQRSTREDQLTAIRYFERALEEDHNYALAYAGLGDAYGTLGNRGHIAPIEGRRKAEEAARRSLAIDEHLAEAHAALGGAYTAFAPYNFSLGDRELRRAIDLSPSLASAHFALGLSLVPQGRHDEALEEWLKARELDPLSSIIARQVAMPYYLKRDYGRALELLRQANELGPSLSSTWEIGVYVQNRLFNEALAELEKASRERKNDPILIYDTGMVFAAQGKRSEALQILKQLEQMSGANADEAHLIAKIYAALNEKELAFLWLERGVATGAIGAFYKDEPVWDPIRTDPRFAQLLRRMGIPS